MAATIPTGFRVVPLSILQLSLEAVLKCGQSFRWTVFPVTGSVATSPMPEYRLCLRDRVVCLRQSSESLFYRSYFPGDSLSLSEQEIKEEETLKWLSDYFQLDVDLVKLYNDWSLHDPVFKRVKTRFTGIRILRQDPWENLVSFICSSNNHIDRITKMVKALCAHYSPPLLSLPSPVEPGTSSAYHPFPPPSALAAPTVASELRSLGFGYRADFIQRTAKMLVDAHSSSSNLSEECEPAEAWLKTLRQSDTGAAREELMKFVGVGRKVADCVLLMSLDKKDVIPVDTHVRQIASKHYGIHSGTKAKANMTPTLYDEIASKLVGFWGEYAGWAHTVLFTADLRSFSTYGLPSGNEMISDNNTSPSPSKKKRKQSRGVKEDDVENYDRVKRKQPSHRS